MKLDSISLHRLKMRLKQPFTTSFGKIEMKDFYLIELKDQDGYCGYGESVAFTIPWYTEETTETVGHMLEQFLIPILKTAQIQHPNDLVKPFDAIKRNHMAKAALEGAVWDLYAKRQGLSLAEALGGSRQEIEVGISLGMEVDLDQLLKKIAHYVDVGYKRVKIKVGPGRDLATLTAVRRAFPDLPLMVDANSAYRLEDLDHLKQFDQFDLMMIEQPLGDDDIYEHAILQKEMETPICLDESIHSLTDVKLAVTLASCQVINIKQGRVGGLTQAKAIHDYCAKHGIDVWIGGMLDSGVGRAHNIALASLSGVNLPGDIAASSHYWEADIIHPLVEVKSGKIPIRPQAGIGYKIDWEAVEKYRVDHRFYSLR